MTPANLTLDKRAKIVQRLPMADGMEWSDIETLARFLDPYQIEKNQTLFLEGDTKPFMIIVLKGKIQIYKQDSSGYLQNMNTVGPGRILGEMALVDGSPRSASAVATEETLFLRLTQEGFVRIQGEFPRLGMKVFAMLARLLSHRLRQTSGSLVEHLHTTAEKEPESLVGEQTMLGIQVRHPIREEPRPAPSPAGPLPGPLPVWPGGGAGGEEEPIPADILLRQYLLAPDKEHSLAEIAKAVNLVHRRLNRVDQWIKLQDAAVSSSAIESRASANKRGGGGVLGKWLRW